MVRDAAQDEHYMRKALAEAEQAYADGEVPIGAVVVAGGRVIGRGHNQVERLLDPTAHAEMLALTAACTHLGGKYLPDCTMYVTIEPCPMCAAALRWAQLGALVYGALEEKFGYSRYGATMLHPKTQVATSVLANECRQLMQDFFASRRR